MNSPVKRAYRFHPYGNENRPPPASVVVSNKLKQTTFQFNNNNKTATQASTSRGVQIKSMEDSYDYNHYLQDTNTQSHQKQPLHQTQVFKGSRGGVKQSTTISKSWTANAAPVVAPPPRPTAKSTSVVATTTTTAAQVKETKLYVFSGTTGSIQVFERQKSRFKQDLNPYFFEIVAQLDSVISEDETGTSGREFTLKDLHGRMHCIFYEMDRTMESFCRDSYLRCVGRMNKKSGLFQCVSVRLASSKEMLYFGFLVTQTNFHLRDLLSASENRHK